jgi:hypothetical protein
MTDEDPWVAEGRPPSTAPIDVLLDERWRPATCGTLFPAFALDEDCINDGSAGLMPDRSGYDQLIDRRKVVKSHHFSRLRGSDENGIR